MKKSDYDKLQEWINVGGGLTPYNDNAKELLEQSSRGEIFTFQNVTKRDLNFHRCYFALLNFIYGYLPSNFKESVPNERFYHFLKHLKGEYEIIFEFKDGTKMIEYESISFGRMNQQRFKEYIREQLPWIYENVIGRFYDGEMYSGIIETIEEEFEKFLIKL
jgi:hypothetical protein